MEALEETVDQEQALEEAQVQAESTTTQTVGSTVPAERTANTVADRNRPQLAMEVALAEVEEDPINEPEALLDVAGVDRLAEGWRAWIAEAALAAEDRLANVAALEDRQVEQAEQAAQREVAQALAAIQRALGEVPEEEEQEEDSQSFPTTKTGMVWTWTTTTQTRNMRKTKTATPFVGLAAEMGTSLQREDTVAMSLLTTRFRWGHLASFRRRRNKVSCLGCLAQWTICAGRIRMCSA